MRYKQSIELKLKAFDFKILDEAVKQIIKNLLIINTKYKGPILMPRKTEKFILNKSPHVDKKSREQFEITSHTRFIIIEATSKTIDVLMKLDISPGIDIKIKMRKLYK